MAKKRPPETPSDGELPVAPVKASEKPKRRRKRRRSAPEEHIAYLVRVTGWNYYYSLRPGDPKSRWDTGPYQELATLSLDGDIIKPPEGKFKRVTVTFSSQREMMQENRAEPPKTIGSLSASDEELSAYIFVPAERMPELVATAQSGRIQIVHLGATRLRYRRGMIHSVSLSTEYDEDEW